jgi:hypothetical protein
MKQVCNDMILVEGSIEGSDTQATTDQAVANETGANRLETDQPSLLRCRQTQGNPVKQKLGRWNLAMQ